MIAQNFLAWDEIEDLGYRFLRTDITANSSRAKKHSTAMVWCQSLEREGSDLDVAVELSNNEREDDLFNAFNNDDGIYIGVIKVDINPITAQRTGTLESYLPQVEKVVAIWKQILPERMNGIPAIGINIHIPGTVLY